MNRIPRGWKLADEWFAEFIRELEASGPRKRKLFRERRTPALPIKETQAREFQEKTEQLTIYLRTERQRTAAA